MTSCNHPQILVQIFIFVISNSNDVLLVVGDIFKHKELPTTNQKNIGAKSNSGIHTGTSFIPISWYQNRKKQIIVMFNIIK